jgi:hypothetical protein
LHCVHLRDRHQESKLSIGPPLCPPCVIQRNRIMTTIVYIIDPVFCLVVSAEWLGVSERFPLPVDAPQGRVTFHLIKSPVC